MSGLEIAGLILGLVPVVQAGIDYHRNSLTGKEMRQLQRTFFTQRNIFMNTIEELLAPLVSDAQLKKLLDDPKGVAWQDLRLSSKLQQHLEGSYLTFKEIMVDVEEMMTELKVILDSNLKRHHVFKKIKLFLSRARGEAGLCRLSMRVGQLEHIVRQSQRLAPSREIKGVGMENYGKVRECAKSLHDALSQGWHCDCTTPHFANLRLEARKAVEAESRGRYGDDDVRFKFLFSFAADEDGSGQPRDWREAELRVDPNVLSNTNNQASQDPTTSQVPTVASNGLGTGKNASSRPSASGSQTQNPPSANKLQKKKVTTFELPPLTTSSAHPPMKEHGATGGDGLEIKDLCKWIKNAQTNHLNENDCLGYLSDAKKTKYGLYSVNRRSDVEPPLASFHVGKPLTPSRGHSRAGARPRTHSFSQSHKYEVASTLGSTILQLHSTPWLERWSKQDIRYLTEPASDTPIQPYIARRFSSSKSPDTPRTNIQPQSFARNADLFTLGIMLIEIAYDRAIEDMREPDDLAGTPAMTQQMTALRLQKEVKDHMGSRYQRVVVGCLYCDFGANGSDADLKSVEFQRKVLEHVVVPLEELLKIFISGANTV